MVPLHVLLYTIYCYLAAVFLIVLFAVPTIIVVCIPERYRYNTRGIYWFGHFFYIILQKMSLLSISYKGLANIPKGPVIFAANHQSAFDIPLLGFLAGTTPHIWLARQDIVRDFWLLRLLITRFTILVDIKKPRSGMRALLKIIHLVKNKERHVLIFPEGGRFVNGKVENFYGGFAFLARKLERPVVPVYIHGIEKLYPPKGWWLQRGEVTVTIGKPIFSHKDETIDAFKNRVHQWFLDQVL